MNLTPYQKIIIKMLSEGKTEKEISGALNRTRIGINNQIRNARAANNARNTIHLVVLSIKNNVI